MNIGKIYSVYISVMAYSGGLVRRLVSHKEGVAPPADSGPADKRPTDTDAEATRAGNQYRALGTLVGCLGIAIVFLAIAPSGWQLGHETEYLLGITKVGLMVLMLLIVLYGGSPDIKRKWLELRSEAEAFRYLHLYDDYKQLQRGAELSVQERLRDGLIAVLEGQNGQVAYDTRSARRYENIESLGNALLWLSVVLALCGAVLHLFVPLNWLIFITAFGPALVGGIHGINAFLCVGELAKKHAAAARSLQGCLTRLEELRKADNPDAAELLRQAAEALEVLTDRDTKWYALVEESRINPA